VKKLLLWTLVFLTVATVCSIPRFGQRENEDLQPPTLDSNCFLDMARVFNGDAPAFDPGLVKVGPHHYNRPLVAFLAGYLGKYVLGGNLRAAFSIIAILSAVGAALLFLQFIRRVQPDWRFYWVPPLLFLTAFPQMDWGYHILSDGLGMSSAFATALFASWVIDKTGQNAWSLPRWWGSVAALLALSSLAFLARETACLAVIAGGFALLRRPSRTGHGQWKYVVILAALVLGEVPHSIYTRHFHLSGVPLGNSLAVMFDWRYMSDFAFKTAVCFNLAWLFCAMDVLCRGRAPVPNLITGWTIAAVLYMGAGYLANQFETTSYPLRLSYGFFPFIFYRVEGFFERQRKRGLWLVLCYVAIQYGINLFGVILDGGQGKITVLDFIQKCRAHLFGF
jgi:hypothetical protein